MKNQNLQIQLAQSENAKLKARWLPQINASADFRWNTQLQTNVIPAGTFGSKEPALLKFGTQFNNTVAVQADQKIYDATKKIDQKINDSQVESQKNILEQQQIVVKQSKSKTRSKHLRKHKQILPKPRKI